MPPKTYAAWPVWRDSTTSDVKFQKMPKREAVRLYHDARRFERQTRQPGRQDGAISRNGLAVLHALLFDFLNYASGRLDPGYQAIARQACISVRSVARGLVALKAAGVLNWQKRSRPEAEARGGFRLVQDTNAYAVLPVSQWLGVGFWRRAEPPPPDPASWGAMPPLPDQLTQAVADRAAGDSEGAVLARLADDPGNEVAGALARLFRPIFDAHS
jgi:hypothetical protein